ncbi:TA system VapC family ribonuclease toxin [Microbacterium sp. Mu-80]|uniref:Ribonuclease VapC n=1 Tax=Microbacterium bandirmense TaxID=3122050 RepID=A0ABU8LA70_9MICO
MNRPRLLDVNVLLALSWDGHVHHERAHERFGSIDAWSTTPITELGLLRLLLTENVVGRPVTAAEAMGQLRALRRAEGWSWVADDASPVTWTVAGDDLRGRRQVTDLQLVNIAASSDRVLATFDAGIVRALRPNERHLVEIWD